MRTGIRGVAAAESPRAFLMEIHMVQEVGM